MSRDDETRILGVQLKSKVCLAGNKVNGSVGSHMYPRKSTPKTFRAPFHNEKKIQWRDNTSQIFTIVKTEMVCKFGMKKMLKSKAHILSTTG